MTMDDAAPADLSRCGNCKTPLQGPHCHQCGQPVKGLVRPLSGWIADFFDSVFDYDGRLWRTLGPLLFRPGYLTREYIAGRRVPYVTPVRLFLFLVVIMFILIRLVADFRVNPVDATLAPERGDQARVERLVSWLPQPERQWVLDDALSPVRPAGQVITTTDRRDDDPTDGGSGAGNIHIGWLPDALNVRLNTAIGQMADNARRASGNPQALVGGFLAVAPQVLFFMLPVFALLLKIVYLFRREMYMHHLLVALHSHSFIAFNLIVMVLLVLLSRWLADIHWLATGIGWLIVALACWIPVNLLLTQKRVYGQGWPMTLLKYVVIGTLYMILLLLASMVAGAISLMTMR